MARPKKPMFLAPGGPIQRGLGELLHEHGLIPDKTRLPPYNLVTPDIIEDLRRDIGGTKWRDRWRR